MLDQLSSIYGRLWPHRPAKELWSDEMMVLAEKLMQQERDITNLRDKLFKIEHRGDDH